MSSSQIRTIELPSDPVAPRQCLTTDSAVAAWHSSAGFRGFWGWINRRCTTIKGKQVIRSPASSSEPIRLLVDMLDEMTNWIQEVPIQPQSNQRFGNLAFRTYVRLVEERLPPLISSWPNLPPALIGQLLPLWLNSHAFGHPTRLDYGTGHELAYILGLWCCVVSGWLGSPRGSHDGETNTDIGEDVEDELILRVFTRYIELTTLLQKTYKLEPAGSHGVWGLDDYCFLPYLFGSAQLLDSRMTPSSSLQLAQSSTPSSSLTDLFTLSLRHITLFKTGASFSEHSPLLYSLCQMPTFTKPHSGLKKMFIGEVVGKRVVVQGLWTGGWTWGNDLSNPSGGKEAEAEAEVSESNGRDRVVTKAPWAR